MKIVKKIVCITLVASLTLCIFNVPIKTNAKTIKEFQDEVNNYTAQLEEKKARIATNDAEIEKIRIRISEIEKEIKFAEEEIEKLQEAIDESNKEIEKKSEESKRIIEYYQISDGNNIYLEYAFGAKTITDMIYRLSVIEQLTEYNQQVMKELEELIKKNEERQKVLSEKKKDLKKNDSKTIEDQIKAAKSNVNYYKSLGCGETEDIQACQYRIQQRSSSTSIPSTNGFYRPMEYGYVTQWYSGYGGHMGVDLSSSNKSIEIYPIASGQVFKIYTDVYGALCVKIRHNVGGQYIYSTYAHLRSFGNIRVGQIVTPYTMIGRMGSTGWSTGPHLHLEITSCDWNSGGGCTWYTYQRSTINPTRYISLPSSWNNR